MLPSAVAVSPTEHLPTMSVQVVKENEPLLVPDTFDQAIVPRCEEYEPVTVAVQVTFVPTAKDDLLQEMVV
jgi:hypothetical protein